MSDAKYPLLQQHGLNLQAIFNIDTLPENILSMLRKDVPELSSFKQLMVFAHGGKAMWHALQQSPYKDSPDPIDTFSIDVVRRYFQTTLAGHQYQLLYPGDNRTAPLQKLGALAGWHHPSAFRIGINAQYGSWFAYRAVVLADTRLTPTEQVSSANPCLTCADKPCIPVCPAKALDKGDLSLSTCLSYRLKPDSNCQTQCISRIRCPIAREHRYTPEQIHYHYSVSMKAIAS